MATRRGKEDPLRRLDEDLTAALRPFYLFHGENYWFRRRAVETLRDRIVPSGTADFSFESRRLDRHSDWADVEAILRSYSFFGGRKLIHLEVPGVLAAETRDALAHYLAETPGQNVLCLEAPNLAQLTAAKNRIAKAGGLVLKFEALSARQLVDWTASRLRARGLAFAAAVPGLLVEALPEDPGEIESELDKLSLMVEPGGRIRAADLQRLVGRQRLEDVWRLAATLRPGGEAEALGHLRELLDSGVYNPASLVPALGWTVTMLLRARLLLDEGLPPAQAAARLPLWGGRAREYVERAGALSRRQLLAWLFNLQKLDLQVKRLPRESLPQLFATTLLESLAGRHLPA
ncbi:MAG: DNA polymerase III subunit delta [Candidatus Krumholzibacteriota bacterium]|nr:DNA polymerase III subunit delta [Candidatus Krumholzibacteriota bacterium]